MRPAITILAYENRDLTEKALNSCLAQDIGPCDIYVIDNGSRDDTWNWLVESAAKNNFTTDGRQSPGHLVFPRRNEENRSPVQVGNAMMHELFSVGYEKILGLPNDVVIPTNFLRLLDQWPRGIVTGSPTDTMNFPMFEYASAVSECTPCSAVLLRRWLHDAMVARYGYFFDEKFKHYASDCDFALRIAALGVRGVQLNVQYYHECSATLKRSTPEVRREMEMQADRDRAYFIQKWGFPVADPYYGQKCGDINFIGEPLVAQ